MAESRRLKGLRTLREFGLPAPEWQEVRNPADVGRLKLADTPHGWTIRTCRNDGRRETGGFFMNNLPPRNVTKALRGRAQMFEEGEFYIVYPSWKFDMSFNVIFDESTFTVEGKSGSQKGISDGTEMPEISLRIPFGMDSRPTVYLGRYTSAVRSRVLRILSYLRRIPLQRYYTEVAVTSEREIFFYDFFPIGL
jgi:hypothetical protein